MWKFTKETAKFLPPTTGKLCRIAAFLAAAATPMSRKATNWKIEIINVYHHILIYVINIRVIGMFNILVGTSICGWHNLSSPENYIRSIFCQANISNCEMKALFA